MEGARMYSACAALRDCLLQLGVGIDGGKDSLTMAAQVNSIVCSKKCKCVAVSYDGTPHLRCMRAIAALC